MACGSSSGKDNVSMVRFMQFQMVHVAVSGAALITVVVRSCRTGDYLERLREHRRIAWKGTCEAKTSRMGRPLKFGAGQEASRGVAAWTQLICSRAKLANRVGTFCTDHSSRSCSSVLSFALGTPENQRV